MFGLAYITLIVIYLIYLFLKKEPCDHIYYHIGYGKLYDEKRKIVGAYDEYGCSSCNKKYTNERIMSC